MDIKKNLMLSALVAASIFSAPLSYAKVSSIIDIRQQHDIDTDKNTNRLLFRSTFDNWALGAKMVIGMGNGSNILENWTSIRNEIEAVRIFRLSDNLVLNSGVWVSFNSENTVVKPLAHIFWNASDYLTLSARYRYDFGINDTVEKQKQHRADFWAIYKLTNKVTTTYNFTYMHEENKDIIIYDDGQNAYEHNMQIAYQWDSSFKPYFEIGSMKVNSVDDDMQLRLRAGIQYRF